MSAMCEMLNCVPLKICVFPQITVPHNVAVFGDGKIK
jgi:hypothetical protein